ncbi:MAG: helix-turn-helix transcriptional regulator, partial [Chloroflexi bacterium]|nr:helix-turn-helix transcriptional regulator [Chloroflexota bacterium]
MAISSELQLASHVVEQSHHDEREMQAFSPQQRFASVNSKLLHWLLRYPLQRVEDIVLALGVSPNTAYRHLAKLADEGLIEYVTPSLGLRTTCRFYYLSNAGVLVATAQVYAEAKALARTWGADEHGLLHLLPRLPALVRLQNLVNSLVAHAPAFLTLADGKRPNFTWHWLRDYQHSFLYHGQPMSYRADAALLLHSKALARSPGARNAEYYSALLLLDPGFVGYHDYRLITQKLKAVLCYRDNPESEHSSQQFPPVIVLVQTPHQREIWQRCAAEVAADLRTEPLTGAILSLPTHGLLNVVWTSPWQKLATPVPCRLRDIFVPLSREALPPGLLRQSNIPEAASSAHFSS